MSPPPAQLRLEAFSAIHMHLTAVLLFWRIKTSSSRLPKNPSFTLLFFLLRLPRYASRWLRTEEEEIENGEGD
jgi:hypothetical protein